MLISRMGTSSLDEVSCFASSLHMLLLAVQTMLDCPEENQTSPTSTPLREIDLPLLFLTSNPRSSPAARRGSSFTIQSPFLSTTVVLVCPANFTLTSFPGSSKPQTGTLDSRCRIMLSVKATASSSC